MGRKFFKLCVVASCVVATAGLANVSGAGAATSDPVVAGAHAVGARASGVTWAPAADLSGAHAAATGSVTVSDGTDDEGDEDGNFIDEPAADIISAQAGVDGTSSIFRMRMNSPTNPNSWGNSDSYGAGWLIDTNFNGKYDYVAEIVNTTGGVKAALVDVTRDAVVCFGTPSFDGTTVNASFGSCGGVLHSFQWGGIMVYADVADFAPDHPWAPPTAAHRNGYFMLGADGKNYGFGGGPNFGGTVGFATAFATRHDGTGLWIADAAGHVFTRGRASYKGGAPSLAAGEVVSAIANTPSDGGYLLFTNRGRAFAYGNAHTHGDLSGHHLNGPIIAAVVTPTGNGYYMVGSDGGIFTFGDAHFRGSMGGRHLNARIVGIAPTPDNRGYWLVGSDGGVFAFGTAGFRGSMGGRHLNAPINGMIAYGNGYLMVASDGGVFVFSNRRFLGSLGGKHLSAPVIGIAAFAV